MIPRSLLLLPRLYLAVIFLVAVYAKLTIPVGFGRALAGFLNSVALQSASPGYKTFIQSVVLPHVTAFASLIIVGELFAGIALLIGFATRAAGALAILLIVNYFLAKGLPPWSPASNDTADIVMCVVIIAGAAGRFFGVDRWLCEKYPNARVW